MLLMDHPRAIEAVASDRALGWVGIFSYESVARAHVRSAGSHRAGELHANVAEVLRERGVDVNTAFPEPLTDDVVAAADLVVTMGCGDACPVHPHVRYADRAVDDPAGRSLADVRVICDDVDRRVRALLADLGIVAEGGAGGR